MVSLHWSKLVSIDMGKVDYVSLRLCICLRMCTDMLPSVRMQEKHVSCIKILATFFPCMDLRR